MIHLELLAQFSVALLAGESTDAAPRLPVLRITEWVAAESGHTSLQPIAVEATDAATFARKLTENEARLDAESAAERATILALLGVIPPQSDPNDALLRDAIDAGVRFDPESDRLLVASERTAISGEDLVREVARARFDQAVDLARFRGGTHPDAAAARELCIEGLIEFVTRRTIAAHADEIARWGSDPDHFRLSWSDRLVAMRAPAFVIERAVTGRSIGLRFVERVAAEYGADGLRRILVDPPRSTEQVIDPERWLGIESIDEPTIVAARDLTSRLPAGTRVAITTALGAFESELVLRLGGDPVRAWIAADGIDGDTLTSYVVGDDRLLQWRVVCDSEADAVDWIHGLRRLCEKRLVYPLAEYVGATPEPVVLSLDTAKSRLEARRTSDGWLRAVARRDGDTVEFLLAPHGAIDLTELFDQ